MKGKLPLSVIDFLIKKYAKNPSGPIKLKRVYTSFSEFVSTEESSNIIAAYMVPGKLLLINTDTTDGKFSLMVESVVHEVAHYNQHMMWDGDDKYRHTFAGKYKLPKGYDQYDLYDLEFETLLEYWIKVYGYEKAPHEIDARSFAQKHLKEAVKTIIDNISKFKQWNLYIVVSHANILGNCQSRVQHNALCVAIFMLFGWILKSLKEKEGLFNMNEIEDMI